MKLGPPIFILVNLFVSACASLPLLNSVSPADATVCNKPFATGQQQYVHAITATLPGDKNSLITGITTVSAEQMRVHAIIMTLEGLVLFEGEAQGDEVNILRSISNFSSVDFAEGLLHDVRLIFLKPVGVPSEIGRSEQGAWVCRYFKRDKSIVDVMIEPNGDWRLVQYDAGFHPLRRVIARYSRSGLSLEKTGAPDRIEFISIGLFSYTLDMWLIQ